MKYHISLRIVHWLMALLIILMIGLGWYMADLPKEDPMRDVLYMRHKSIGVTILILFFLRVAIRISTKIPPLPNTISFINQQLAHLGHGVIYILMAMVPLSGYAMSNMYGFGVSMFGIDMPKLFPTNHEIARIAKEVHSVIPYVLLAVVILHALAALKHRFFEKPENDVLGRML